MDEETASDRACGCVQHLVIIQVQSRHANAVDTRGRRGSEYLAARRRRYSTLTKAYMTPSFVTALAPCSEWSIKSVENRHRLTSKSCVSSGFTRMQAASSTSGPNNIARLRCRFPFLWRHRFRGSNRNRYFVITAKARSNLLP